MPLIAFREHVAVQVGMRTEAGCGHRGAIWIVALVGNIALACSGWEIASGVTAGAILAMLVDTWF